MASPQVQDKHRQAIPMQCIRPTLKESLVIVNGSDEGKNTSHAGKNRASSSDDGKSSSNENDDGKGDNARRESQSQD